MFIRINLSNDSIVNWSNFPIQSNQFGTVFTIADGVPLDYSLDKYDYIPAVSGVYDPNGWYPKEPPAQNETQTVKRFYTIVNTTSSGLFSVTFPDGFFSTRPMVSVEVIATNTRVHSHNTRLLTTTQITGVVKRSRPLPSSISLLTNLQSYDTWVDPGVVQVCIKAEEIIP